MQPRDLPDIDVILESARDQRTLDFLISTCGVDRVRQAREQLPGHTRPYVSNLAKILGVTIPIEIIATSRVDARRKISELKERLAKGNWEP